MSLYIFQACCYLLLFLLLTASQIITITANNSDIYIRVSMYVYITIYNFKPANMEGSNGLVYFICFIFINKKEMIQNL